MRRSPMFTNAMRFGLGEDIDALRDTVHKFAADRIAPRAAAIDRDNAFPAVAFWNPSFRLLVFSLLNETSG